MVLDISPSPRASAPAVVEPVGDGVDPRMREEYKKVLLISSASSPITHDSQAFDLFDGDGSGEVDSSELHSLMEALGMTITPQEARDLVMEVCLFTTVFCLSHHVLTLKPQHHNTISLLFLVQLDADGSGLIEFEEFLHIMTKQRKSRHKEIEERLL